MNAALGQAEEPLSFGFCLPTFMHFDAIEVELWSVYCGLDTLSGVKHLTSGFTKIYHGALWVSLAQRQAHAAIPAAVALLFFAWRGAAERTTAGAAVQAPVPRNRSTGPRYPRYLGTSCYILVLDSRDCRIVTGLRGLRFRFCFLKSVYSVCFQNLMC